MFTGLVEDVGTVRGIVSGAEGARLGIATRLGAELRQGDSISVEGACLTVTDVGAESFAADVINQTLGLTTLGGLGEGDRVNLERALRVGDALGGHIVQGHVDGVGEVLSVGDDGFARRLRMGLPDGLGRYLVEHGSVAVSGVSLTVAGLGDDWLEVALIPETLERTTLGDLNKGGRVNLELDVLARHVERLLRFQPEGSN
jgi:riboflavin synthase